MNEAPVILIIDDSEDNRYTFGRYLRRNGYEVLEAATAEEGLKKAGENPSLIIVDVQLPDRTGFEVCRMLKDGVETASIPVLHTSASFRRSSDRTQGLSGGADGYLIQPIDPEELLATVNALLRIRKAEATANALAIEWKSTFEAVNEGICLTGEDGLLDRANPAFETIFPGQDLKNVSFGDLLKRSGIDSSIYEGAWASGTRATQAVNLGGRSFLLTFNPIDGGENRVQGCACVFSDVTVIRRAEEALKEHNEELEKRIRQRTAALNDANAQLESFCYSVAHDLRAPIRTMQGFSDILMEDYSGQLDEDARGYLGRIHRGAKKMDRLIQDLLRYSRLSREEIVLEEVNLFNLVAELTAESEREFGQKAEVFRVKIPKDLTVPAHAVTLRQALLNLLSNAVKFVAEGTVPEVQVTAAKEEGGVVLRIRDNGIGIDPEHQPKVFEMFERIHSDKYAGTGIGLAIVRRAMERMGGSVGLESEPNRGSVFWLKFKKERSQKP